MAHRIDIRVYYEDTDMAGIVYHANYLKFIERGRSEAVRAAGIDQRAMLESDGLAFAVRDMTLEFLSPARFDDILRVESRVEQLRGASIVMVQEVWRSSQKVFAANVRLAILQKTGKPSKIPAEISQKLATLTDK